jgi:Family of unknown function (DUF6193)
MTGERRAQGDWEWDWLDLVNGMCPPFPENDWLTPLYWPLVQAAYADPVLRALFPAKALNVLVFPSDPDWWQTPAESGPPGIAVGSEGWYSVVADCRPGAEALFESRDPNAAVVCLARMIADGAISDME